jgi:hypothetical protein
MRSSLRVARGGGAVIRDGGVMGNGIGLAHDPSVAVRRRHLPGFAREGFHIYLTAALGWTNWARVAWSARAA